MIKLLGALDVLTGIFLVLLNFGFSNWVVIALLIYLLLKSIAFFADILSLLDLVIVVIGIIFIFLGTLSFFLVPAGVYLIAKGFYSCL